MNRQQATAMLIAHCNADEKCYVRTRWKRHFDIVRTA